MAVRGRRIVIGGRVAIPPPDHSCCYLVSGREAAPRLAVAAEVHVKLVICVAERGQLRVEQ